MAKQLKNTDQCQPTKCYKKEKKMKVTINDSCIGCGACESICDAVFCVVDRACVKEDAVAGNEDCVKEAADACPVSAIEVA